MITKAFIDMHGGEISVYSAGRGHGTTFTLRIPLTCPDLGPYKLNEPDLVIQNLKINPMLRSMGSGVRPIKDASSVHSLKDFNVNGSDGGKSSQNSSEGSRLTLKNNLQFLIVDDSKLNRRMVRKLLQSCGYVCEEAEDGLEAVKKVKNRIKLCNALLAAKTPSGEIKQLVVQSLLENRSRSNDNYNGQSDDGSCDSSSLYPHVKNTNTLTSFLVPSPGLGPGPLSGTGTGTGTFSGSGSVTGPGPCLKQRYIHGQVPPSCPSHTSDHLLSLLTHTRSISDSSDVVDGPKCMYDAILMDFEMPNMDGPTATQIIRELGYNGLILGITGEKKIFDR